MKIYIKNWQIMSKLGFVLDFQKAVTPNEALRKYAKKLNFESYDDMCDYLGISNKWVHDTETSKIILR